VWQPRQPLHELKAFAKDTQERRVLIVDDDRPWRVPIQRVLRPAGFQTLTARDGLVAHQTRIKKALRQRHFLLPCQTGGAAISAAPRPTSLRMNKASPAWLRLKYMLFSVKPIASR